MAALGWPALRAMLLFACGASRAAALTPSTTFLSAALSTTTSQAAANGTSQQQQVSPGERCLALSRDCAQCNAEGCHFCELGPQPWQAGLRGTLAGAQRELLDYTCSVFICADLRLYRPGTQHSRTLHHDECGAVQWPQSTPEVSTTERPPAPSVDAAMVELTARQAEDVGVWPRDWGPLHWLAIIVPSVILVTTITYLWFRKKQTCVCRKKRSRVHVSPHGSGPGSAALWDFANAGPLSITDVESADYALAEAEEAEAGGKKALGHPVHRCIVLSMANELKQVHLSRLGVLLQNHPTVTLNLYADWRGADDGALFALAALLRARGRCHLQAVPQEGLSPLLLPRGASAAAAVAVSWSVASGAHSEVDALVFELPGAGSGLTSSTVIDLSALRQSYQELFLNRHRLGDLGCSAACAFVGSWAGRLQRIKMVECDVGDSGAAGLAKLLAGGPEGQGVASALRELCLSANRIGDKGARSLADALPTCDSLEKLLLDRNRIGAPGAKALAERLPRSNLRELVLGSHLGGNPLGPPGVEALAGALDDRLPRAAANRATRLIALNLEDCGIGEMGAKAIAATMPKSELQVLAVSRGGMGDAGAAAILKALPETLLSLDLAGNMLGDATAGMVGEVLARVPHIAVSLAQNCLSPPVRTVLSENHGKRIRI